MIKRQIFFLCSLLLATQACSNLYPPASVYENDAFSISIPEGWGWGTESSVYGHAFKQLIQISHPYLFSIATFTLATTPLTGEVNLESRFTQTYEGFLHIANVSKQDFEHEGLSGYEITYTLPLGEELYAYHDIWLEKDTTIYVLSFSCLESSQDDYTAIFDQILDNFSFKE
jgi:hypothetical protein